VLYNERIIVLKNKKKKLLRNMFKEFLYIY